MKRLAMVLWMTVYAGCGTATQDSALVPENVQALNDGCDLNGTWALRFEIPVSWPATMAVEAGHGTVTQWAKATRVHHGDTFTDALSVCGINIPDNVARDVFNNETYGITFPPALFDSGVLPTMSVISHLSGTTPGSSFNSDPIAVLLGMRMDDPYTAVWPAKANGIQAVDIDGDSHPGITVQATSGGNYSAPPVNMFRTKRAAHFYIALRSVVQSASGHLESCDVQSGTVNIPVIAGKAAINSRILGCQRVDGGICTQSEFELIDKLQSGYDLNGSATVKITRIAADATCASVRAMSF